MRTVDPSSPIRPHFPTAVSSRPCSSHATGILLQSSVVFQDRRATPPVRRASPTLGGDDGSPVRIVALVS